MNAHHDFRRDPDAATRQAAWMKEWDIQFSKLPQEKQDAIKLDPMHPAADQLDEIVERILCERGEL